MLGEEKEMKVLVIGSCALDVIIDLEKLPSLNEDVNTKDLAMSLGGMAYNVYNVIKLFGRDAIFGCPIGEGILANIVKGFLSEKGYEPIGTIKGVDNGMCMCLVDDSKERSFISHHGAEYRFEPELFKDIDFNEVDWIYFGGLEIEDVDGPKIIDFIADKPSNLFFAPGPRLDNIDQKRLERIYALKPVLHINEREAELITGKQDLIANAEEISALTKNTVIITLGEKGTLLKEVNKKVIIIPTQEVKMVDSTGAGDNHAGAILACLNQGMCFEEAIKIANVISGYVVRQKGASLTKENYEKAMNDLQCK